MSVRNKFRNVKTRGYASKREAKRASELLLLESAGKIEGLAFQQPFELISAQYVDGKCVERSCKYVADFVYYENGERVVEDAKGFRDPVYRIKRKMMLATFGIRIRET